MRSTQAQFTWAKAHLSALFDVVVGGRGLRVICRHKSRPLALVGAEDLEGLLAPAYPFHPEVSHGSAGEVSVWLPELAIFGQGPGLDAAVEDLIDEIEVYLEEWESRLHHAPDHAARAWWVRRLQLADDRDAVRRMLFVGQKAEGDGETDSEGDAGVSFLASGPRHAAADLG